MKSIISTTAIALAATLVRGDDSVREQVAELRVAPTEVDRLNILTDSQFVFDFLNPPSGVVKGAGGHTVEASSANFAAVVGNGVAMTIGFLGPCGLNTPHTHPRATEINFSVNGTLLTGLLVENGARFITNQLQPGMATVFPQGAIHFEMNEGCEPATFVAAFNNEDPGVQSLAQRFFGLPPSIVSLALGDIGVEEVATLNEKIPDNIVLGVSECQKRCNITVPSQPTNQQQPRVSGNALPSGFTAPAPPSTSPIPTFTADASSTPSPSTGTGNLDFSNNLASDGSVKSDASGSSSSNSDVNPLVIALIIVCGVLVLGYIGVAAVYFQRRAKRRAEYDAGWKAVGGYARTRDHNLGEYGDEKPYDPVDTHLKTPSTSDTRFE